MNHWGHWVPGFHWNPGFLQKYIKTGSSSLFKHSIEDFWATLTVRTSWGYVIHMDITTIYMYIYIYVYIYICIYIYVYIYMYIYICIYIYIYSETYAYSHVPARVHHLLISLQPGVGSMPAWRWVGLRLSNSRYQWRLAEDGVDRYAVRCSPAGSGRLEEDNYLCQFDNIYTHIYICIFVYVYIYIYVYTHNILHYYIINKMTLRVGPKLQDSLPN